MLPDYELRLPPYSGRSRGALSQKFFSLGNYLRVSLTHHIKIGRPLRSNADRHIVRKIVSAAP